MKTLKVVAITGALLVGALTLGSSLPRLMQNHTELNKQDSVSNGIPASNSIPKWNAMTVPGMSSGYSCDLGELGNQKVESPKKEFWGDDSVSQGFKQASDGAGHCINRIKNSL